MKLLLLVTVALELFLTIVFTPISFLLFGVPLSIPSISFCEQLVIATKDGEIVATGVNRVTASCDPTAHAEVSAIRAAAAKLGTFDLSGYEIYTSCEPCPMCLGAIYWARLDKMYYGNNKTDAKNIGFDDSFIYDELQLKPEDRKLPSEILLHNEALTAFKAWVAKEDRVEY